MIGPPEADNDYLVNHVGILLESYERLIGQPLLIPLYSPAATARAIFNADFAVLSSGTEPEPLFNYANQTALSLFEFDWYSLTKLPARESAEPVHQSTRAKLMQQVQETGFIQDYAGIRISASGRRFMIEGATVWNVIDAKGMIHGQAATFSHWRDV